MKLNHTTVNLLIDRYGYYQYIVKLNKSLLCECVNPSTKEADPYCKKCLGTGHHIKIIKVFGASREGREYESDRTQAFAVTPKIFYFKGNLNIGKDDILIDSENVYIIYSYQHHRGVKGHQAFTRCVCPDLKLNKMIFLKMFKEVLNDKLSNKNR
jgi:hypothetical protein